jgi:antitoxin (DNA-binding transcriptional repressor) of toxin-antitoxin stability system
VIIAERSVGAGFAVALHVKEPFPFPLPVTVSQLWLLCGDQFCVQPDGVPVTITVPTPPAAGMVPGDERLRLVQAIAVVPACVTVMEAEFTRTVADRELAVGFGEAVHVKDPEPSPLPDTANHAWSLEAVQV